MKITIIGAGNTGQAIAGYAALKNQEILLYTSSEEKAKTIAEKGLRLSGALDGHVFVRTTTDMGEAVSHGEVLLVCTTAQGHKVVCERMKPHLRQEQAIVIFNGNWGALEFRKILSGDIEAKDLTVAETGAMLVICNAKNPGEVHVKKIKQEITIAALEESKAAALTKRFVEVFPQFRPLKDVYATSFNNANTILHTPISLFNAARMDGNQAFAFYREGASPAAMAYVEKMDAERLSVGERLGVDALSALGIINSFWTKKHDNLYDAIHENDSYKISVGPGTLKHRFFYEDVPFGLVPLSELGRRIGVPTPYMDGIIGTAELLLDVDFRSSGPDLDYEAMISDLAKE